MTHGEALDAKLVFEHKVLKCRHMYGCGLLARETVMDLDLVAGYTNGEVRQFVVLPVTR